MPLDPQCVDLLEAMAKMNAGRPQLHEGTPEEARRAYSASVPPTPDEPLASVEDRTIPGPAGPLRLRVYRPEGDGVLPAVVYFHGGGWVMGNIESHNALCHGLASRSGCVVAAVDYRLAPEDPFPAGLEDCVAAVGWVVANAGDLGVDPDRVAVGGDSSGGNLAAAACLVARDRGGPPIAFQLLVYPVLAFGYDTPSYAENAEGYFLTETAMRWFSDQYLSRPEDATDPYAAPVLATDLTGLPPAHMVSAEFDPLRDEDEAYVRALAGAGVAAGLSRYDGMIHGFVRMAASLDQGRVALDECAAVLRRALRPGEARLPSASGADAAGAG